MGVQIGAVFPQTEFGGDVGAVRAFGQGIEELGYRHVLVYDHVVGADPAVHAGWKGPYDVDTTFHEPFVMFGYLAAATTLELVTGVIILPQRQTVLVAKQAAEVDLLSQGRFRLGVGIGWNTVEYDALNEDFPTRGVRSEEQIELMRRLWTERSVSFEGKFDNVTGAGIAPLPVQRPIPVWIGTAAAKGYERVGRIADGWFPMMGPGPELDAARAAVRDAAVAAGRDPDAIGMEGQVRSTLDPEGVATELKAWAQAGATHASISTMGHGRKTVDEHLAALAAIAELHRFG